MPGTNGLAFHPVTADRWADLESLFGPERGADSGCWCMWWRTTRKEWEAMGKPRRKAAFKKIVKSNAVPGILAYHGSAPVGWCAIAPRRATPSLDRSRVAKPVDDQPVWSITCFYIARSHRKRGLMTALIDAACDHAAGHGAGIVEAYPPRTRPRSRLGRRFHRHRHGLYRVRVFRGHAPHAHSSRHAPRRGFLAVEFAG